MAHAIREPHPDKASAIADLHVATWKEAYSSLLPEAYFSEEHVAGRHRMWQHVFTHPRDDKIVRVAETDGEIIGFAWAGPGEGINGEEPPRDRLLSAALEF